MITCSMVSVIINELNDLLPIERSISVGKRKWMHDFDRDVWFTIRRGSTQTERHKDGRITCNSAVFQCQVAPAEGGAWHYFGMFTVEQHRITVSTKTVDCILMRDNTADKVTFEYCCPGFPENFVDYLKQAALNSGRCYGLANRRSQRRWIQNA
jgi:hypothetical protein